MYNSVTHHSQVVYNPYLYSLNINNKIIYLKKKYGLSPPTEAPHSAVFATQTLFILSPNCSIFSEPAASVLPPKKKAMFFTSNMTMFH